ncbi:Alpha/Beta hydrolase protein [Boletus edulis BED1]|uniref:Carboxylic ester hydrolase n=1 Tax=Boletus edulis BED1 TaxID=1328754 RepID=A0AAD4C987_BOLED|nr:Alpha/Beta hydrolase protein [Boletus edulis BED1]
MMLWPCIPPALRVLALAASTLASPTARATGAPLVTLDYGAFQGFGSAGGTESFLGVPFAQPPLGQLRFNNPVPPQPFSGIRNATWFGNACPQQPVLGPNESFPDNPGLNGITKYLGELQPHGIVAASEDCLYLNVVRPAGVSAGANLPVVVWIYGGAFESGDASAYNGTQIVSRSLDLKSPVIYVSFNYRMNAFGFLGGKEVQAAGLGNFGLYDQRFALQWVQKYILLFGGNPKQVILWGQSSGSISVMLQMVAYDGQLGGLFQGAVMESGSASPMHDITIQQAQDDYDFLVEQANCTAANDTLNCLRQAPYQTIINAVLQTTPLLSYQALNISWRPLVDGVFLKQSTRQSLSEGKYARVPAILGDVDDEGTLFSLYSFNVTTNEQFLDYIQTIFLVGATEDEINSVEKLYPDDPTLGSPYSVGTNDTLTPEYKRISSFQGDFYFHVPRRYALSYLSCTQNVWSYLWKRDKFVPGVGSFHESDLQEFYDLTGSSDWVGADALVNFAYTLNPNVPTHGYPSGAAPSLLSDISWPQYQAPSVQLLTFEDQNVLTFTDDTFRAEAIEFLDEMQERMDL